MEEKINTLYNHDIGFNYFTKDKKIVSCRWVFVVKYHSGDTIERLKV